MQYATLRTGEKQTFPDTCEWGNYDDGGKSGQQVAIVGFF